MENINKIILSEYQSRMFLLMFKNNIDIIDGINKFMSSNLVKEIDLDYSYLHLYSPNIWLEMLNEENKLVKIDRNEYPYDAIEWLGYFYRRWHFITREPSFKINRYLSSFDGISSYYTLHQLDMMDAINIVKSKYNLKRNAHRRYEFKKNIDVISSVNLNNDLFRSYLAKKIIYKLINDENVNDLSFSKDNNIMLSRNNDISITSIYIDKEDKNFMSKFNLNPKRKLNYLFTFIKLKRNDLSSVEDESIFSFIKNMRDSLILNKYDFVYFYISGLLYEINNSNEIKKYYLPISKRDLISIKKEIDQYKLYIDIEKEISDLNY